MAEINTITMLPVMEAFYTIQGEGFYAGVPAYFIRLGGCDVGCHWCDVKESWDADAHPKLSIDQIIQNASQFPKGVVVITGGEPLMYDLTALTSSLKEAGFRTHLETSGAYPLTGSWDWVCFSPKKFKKPLASVAAKAHELKVVVFHQSDFQWAEQHAQLINQSCIRLLQPEWSKSNKMLPLIVDYVKMHTEWRISLQTHKYMDVP
jgi:7-carboxy-7-deazaguanine synthase